MLVHLSVVILAAFIVRRLVFKSYRCLPPGPKPLPIIGNLLQFPKGPAWIEFAKWRDDYGPVAYANFFGKHALILNSHKACVDLMDKRSAIYSDRPRLVMLGELMNFDWNLSIMRYSARWREQRRVFHQFFYEKASLKYCVHQEKGTYALLKNLLQKPDEFLDHTRLAFASIILRIVYGIDIKSRDDQYCHVVEEAVQVAVQAALPGRFMVDLLPILKYVPTWFPGSKFKRLAHEWRGLMDASKELPALYADKAEASGMSTSTVYSEMLHMMRDERSKQTQRKGVDSAEEVAKNAAAMAYLAGADTTVSSIQTLFMVLANHPEVQRAAQKELDAVVGSNRLPTFSDLPDLLYISAIIKELLRWHVVVPLAVVHSSTQDDVYGGYFIPKGTTVIPNSWLILHDPEVYPEPFEFKPSRWLIETPEGAKLNENIPDPDIACFGYGRRSCPGQHFARNSLLIATSNILACFNITPLDKTGKPIQKVVEAFTPHTVTYPEPFKVSITPRSERVQRLIQDANM